MKVALHQITIALSDFAGGVRSTLRLPLSAAQAVPFTQAALVRLLTRQIEACLADAGGSVRKRLAGVGTVAADLYEPALRAAMAQAMVLPHRTRVQLVVRHEGDEVWACGSGTVLGSVLGALIVQFLVSGLLLLDVGIGMRMVIIGQVLIAAVVFDVLYRRATGERMT